LQQMIWNGTLKILWCGHTSSGLLVVHSRHILLLHVRLHLQLMLLLRDHLLLSRHCLHGWKLMWHSLGHAHHLGRKRVKLVGLRLDELMLRMSLLRGGQVILLRSLLGSLLLLHHDLLLLLRHKRHLILLLLRLDRLHRYGLLLWLLLVSVNHGLMAVKWSLLRLLWYVRMHKLLLWLKIRHLLHVGAILINNLRHDYALSTCSACRSGGSSRQLVDLLGLLVYQLNSVNGQRNILNGRADNFSWSINHTTVLHRVVGLYLTARAYDLQVDL